MISRQSLLRLSRDLDEMRRLSAQLDGRDVGGMTGEALTSSQSHFRADLEDASGQGAGWLDNLRKTYLELLEARARLPQIDRDSSQGLVPFKQSSEELKTLVRSTTVAAGKQPHPQPPGVRERTASSVASAARDEAASAIHSRPKP